MNYYNTDPSFPPINPLFWVLILRATSLFLIFKTESDKKYSCISLSAKTENGVNLKTFISRYRYFSSDSILNVQLVFDVSVWGRYSVDEILQYTIKWHSLHWVHWKSKKEIILTFWISDYNRHFVALPKLEIKTFFDVQKSCLRWYCFPIYHFRGF